MIRVAVIGGILVFFVVFKALIDLLMGRGFLASLMAGLLYVVSLPVCFAPTVLFYYGIMFLGERRLRSGTEDPRVADQPWLAQRFKRLERIGIWTAGTIVFLAGCYGFSAVLDAVPAAYRALQAVLPF